MSDSVVYTDEEAASLTSEQFNDYMNGGDPLGKNKKKQESQTASNTPPAGGPAGVRYHNEKLKEALKATE